MTLGHRILDKWRCHAPQHRVWRPDREFSDRIVANADKDRPACDERDAKAPWTDYIRGLGNAATDHYETSKINVFCRRRVESGGSRHIHGNGAAVVAVHMACGPCGPEAPRVARDRPHDRLEGVYDCDPLCVQMGHRRLDDQESSGGAPFLRLLASGRGPDYRLWSVARRHVVDATGT